MKVNKKTFNRSSIKRVVGKFHVVAVQNNGREMYKKSFLRVQSCFFANQMRLYQMYKGTDCDCASVYPGRCLSRASHQTGHLEVQQQQRLEQRQLVREGITILIKCNKRFSILNKNQHPKTFHVMGGNLNVYAKHVRTFVRVIEKKVKAGD